MHKIKVWDPFIRVFHWAIAALFVTNALFTDDEGTAHEWVGYALGALLMARLIWGIIGPEHACFRTFPPSLSAAASQLTDIARGRHRRHLGHSPLGAWMIYNLLIALLVIVLSGHMMTTDMFWGMEGPEELHEFAVTWAEISIVIHVAAVLFESRRTGVNLPRAMITGYKSFKSQ